MTEGGRGAIFVKALENSSRVKNIYCFPGREAWMSDGGKVKCFLGIKAEQADSIIEKCKQLGVNLIIAGQEEFLAAEGADKARSEGVAVVGCGRMAAEMETSKVFAKRFFKEHEIPTARFDVANSPGEASVIAKYHFLINKVEKLVFKADGLAEGKGVRIASNLEEADRAIHDLMEEGGKIQKVYPNAGKKLVVEDYLPGRESSETFFCDGDNLVKMKNSIDHKYRFEGDTGDMTGGIGLIAPDPNNDREIESQVWKISRRIAGCLKNDEREFRGILYLGLMVVEGQVYVLEVNVRFGAPEAQGTVPLLASDFAELSWATATRQIHRIELKWHEHEVTATVTLVEGIYPAPITDDHKGKPISGLEEASALDGVIVLHAGTKIKDGVVVTDGGRVIDIVAKAKSYAEAIALANKAAAMVHWDGVDYRKDIGQKALAAL